MELRRRLGRGRLWREGIELRRRLPKSEATLVAGGLQNLTGRTTAGRISMLVGQATEVFSVPEPFCLSKTITCAEANSFCSSGLVDIVTGGGGTGGRSGGSGTASGMPWD